LCGRKGERGDLDELRARAGSGDTGADLALHWLLAERGDLDELNARVRAGDWVACHPDGSISRG